LGVRQHTNYCETSVAEIYVALLDEGTTVWRPVRATHLGADVFEIAPDAAPPEDERWAFGPGEHVRCEPRTFSGGERGLVAVERAVRAV
jgi:hypothetical protein